MKEKAEIVSSSIVLLIMFNIFNLLNLLFQIFVAHNLEVVEYGIFTALFSFIYIFAVFSESIQLTVTKRIAQAESKQSMSDIFHKAMRSSLFVAVVAFVFYFALLGVSNIALKISWALIFLNSLTVFLALTSPVVRGVLQGQKRFFDLGVNMIVEGSTKFLLGVLFVFAGWKIFGALGAVLLSMAIPIFYGIRFQIKDILFLKKNKDSKEKFSLFQTFSPEVLVMVGSILLLFMLDAVIARAVLSPENAGYYAIASTIAKMAFIGTQPISKAMISHVATSKNPGESKSIFKKSFLILISVLTVGIILASFFSSFIVSIFGGSDKLVAATILPIVLLAFAFISISNLILFYKIAIDKTRLFWILPIALSIFIVMLVFAPTTLLGFSLSYLATTIMFLIASLLVVK